MTPTGKQDPRSRAAVSGHGGFTLIELMVVVAIVAILTTIAVASYDFAVVKARRSQASACLMEAAQMMERRYTTALSYVGAAPVCSQSSDLSGHYGLPALVGTTTARTYTLRISPTGSQATSDTKCGALSVDQTGKKTISGTGAVSDCF